VSSAFNSSQNGLKNSHAGMSTNRQRQIDEIINARKPMAQRAKEFIALFEQVEQGLATFESFIKGYYAKPDFDLNTKARLQELLPELDDIRIKLNRERETLSLLSARFSRTTLNIGVLGRAGEGKSTFLQQVTGLDSKVIPAGEGFHCTGTTSIVVNHKVEDPYADIEFHTADSFLKEVIGPFYTELGLGVIPYSIEDFRETFPARHAARKAELANDATKCSQLDRIAEIHQNLRHYEPLLGRQRNERETNIRSYIAQIDANGEKIWFWPAVRSATIYCTFPHADIGRIGIVDTPGLGDFISGAEQRLVETIGMKLDILLFVRRPKSRAIIEPQDTHLYNLVTGALPNLPLSRWAYFIVNDDTVNTAVAKSFLTELSKSNIRIRLATQANFRDSNSVETALSQILDDVALNLAKVDNELFENWKAGLSVIHTSLDHFAQKAATVLPKAVADPDRQLFRTLFNQLWDQLSTKFGSTIEKYWENRNIPDQAYLDRVSEIIENLRNLDSLQTSNGPLLPDADRIKTEAAAPGLPMWQANKFHAMRVYLSAAFEELNVFFDSRFHCLRKELADNLRDQDGGKLGFIGDGDDFWEGLVKLWDEHDEADRLIVTRLINRLRSATLSFRGLIQPRIRKCLEVLDQRSVQARDYNFRAGDSPQEVRDKLEMAWDNCLFECEKEIRVPATEVAMSLLAIAEDFVDAFLREGGADAAKERWKGFFYWHRNEVWPDHFENLEAESSIRRQWEGAVKQLLETANLLKR